VLYAFYDANAKNAESNVIDVDGATPSEASASKRSTGWTISKEEAKSNASSQAGMEMIKTLLPNREVSSEKRKERKRREKDEAMRNYVYI
jgi:hypothetical protein